MAKTTMRTEDGGRVEIGHCHSQGWFARVYLKGDADPVVDIATRAYLSAPTWKRYQFKADGTRYSRYDVMAAVREYAVNGPEKQRVLDSLTARKDPGCIFRARKS